jgi:GAF domain-containing protein
MSVTLHDVHQALAQLGRLRFGEMNIEEAVREIVHTTHAMFSVDGAGLMLVDADQHLRNVAASDERFAHLEDLQIRHQEGPCIDAFDARELVGVEDLGSDARWPAFREAAVARRVRAVLASPLPYNQDAVGVVAVVSGQRRPWTPEAELALLAFTDLAALLIASVMQGQQQSELAVQLQAALKSRQVIEQAKGVLTGRDGITPREAYVQLRARARNERRKLVAVCSEVVKDAASGPAGRLHQARAGSALDVVSTPPRIMRLVVMSVLVLRPRPGSGCAAPCQQSAMCTRHCPKG